MNVHVDLKPQGQCHVELVRDLERYWDTFAEGFQKGCDKSGGQLSAGFIWQELRSGHAFMLIAVDEANIAWGAAALRFETWPSGTKLVGLGLSGKHINDWIAPMCDEIRRRAKQGGANSIIDQGEPGLEKVLRNQPGFRVLGVVYEVVV